MTTDSDIELAALVAATLATIRSKAPRLDGWPVIVIAYVLALGFTLAAEPDLRKAILRGLIVGSYATGGVALVGYGATKIGGAMGHAAAVTTIASMRPPPPAPPALILETEHDFRKPPTVQP